MLHKDLSMYIEVRKLWQASSIGSRQPPCLVVLLFWDFIIESNILYKFYLLRHWPNPISEAYHNFPTHIYTTIKPLKTTIVMMEVVF